MSGLRRFSPMHIGKKHRFEEAAEPCIHDLEII